MARVIRRRRKRSGYCMHSIKDEARTMAQLALRGASPVERVRLDIGLTRIDEEVLRRHLHSIDVDRIVAYRAEILREFERQIQAPRHVATWRNGKVASQFGQSKQVKERELKITKQQNPHSVTDEHQESTAGSSEAFA